MRGPPKPLSLALGLGAAGALAFCLGTAFLNFVRFGVRAKQAEVKQTLKRAYVAQRAFAADRGRWATSLEELGLEDIAHNRYQLSLAQSGELLTPPARPDGGHHAILGVDTRLAPRVPDLAHAAAIPDEVWRALGDPDAGLVVATGDLDVDPTLDVWSVAPSDRVIAGERVPAGEPFCHVNDVTQ